MYVYSIYDNAAECFGMPYFAHTDAVAKREFLGVYNAQGTSIQKNPSDFDLWLVGSFEPMVRMDDMNLKPILSGVKPTLIMRGRDLESITG